MKTTRSIDELLNKLVHDISSIRVGKTFSPHHYTEPVKQQLLSTILASKPKWGGTIGGIDDYWKGYHDGVVEWEQAIKKIFESTKDKE